MKLEELIGKEVRLFPGDTYYKYAILLEVSDKGYLFKITECQKGCNYAPSDIVFFSHSTQVTFKLHKN